MKNKTINIRKKPFCLAACLKWWESKADECRPGHFNTALYLAILEIKCKS